MPSNELYFLPRNAEETARLNWQHDFLFKLTNNTPIHPSIPTDHISSIADLATGTGIWLKDTRTYLNSRSQFQSQPQPQPQDPKEYYLHGFDISPTQFATLDTIHLSVHDTLQPFPAEHRNRYDLVHVRLLVGALRKVEYAVALRNVLDILKPGGYFQWDEIDISAYDVLQPEPDIITEIKRIVTHTTVKVGLCITAPEIIETGAVEVGFEDVIRETYTTVSRPEELKGLAREWLVRAVWSLLPSGMVKSGLVDGQEEAVKRIGELTREFEEDTDVLPLVNLQVIVGRKRESSWYQNCTLM